MPPRTLFRAQWSWTRNRAGNELRGAMLSAPSMAEEWVVAVFAESKCRVAVLAPPPRFGAGPGCRLRLGNPWSRG
jgi:hypothetical protein